MPRIVVRRIIIVLTAIVLVSLVALWLARKPIADATLRRALAARGVRARYVVKDIGLRWERIEDVSIGDPAAPDLTAKWVELRIDTGFSGMSVKTIRAGGVRLKGRLVGQRLRFGDLDRLLPLRGSKAFALPDLTVDVVDTGVTLESPFGQVVLLGGGKGNLAGGFIGAVAARSDRLGIQDCFVTAVSGQLRISVAAGMPSVSGPIVADGGRCRQVAFNNSKLVFAATSSRNYASWQAVGAISSAELRHPRIALNGVTGTIRARGSASGLGGRADLAVGMGTAGATQFLAMRVAGTFSDREKWSEQGKLSIGEVVTDPSLVDRLQVMLSGTAETPVAPIAGTVLASVRKAARSIKIDADFIADQELITISKIDALAADGTRLRVAGGDGILIGGDGVSADLRVSAVRGLSPVFGGMLRRRKDGLTVGLVTIAPLAADNARLSIAPLRFALNPSGAMRFETVTTIDGPLGSGYVRGLRVPINVTASAANNFAFGNACETIALNEFRTAALRVGPTQARLCSVDDRSLMRLVNGQMRGKIASQALKLVGSVGGEPFEISTRSAQADVTGRRFAVDRLRAQRGVGNQTSSIAIDAISGRIGGAFPLGDFKGFSGQLANVPLVLSQGAGRWTYFNRRLGLAGALRVADATAPARYNPLVSDDVKMTVTAKAIVATATLRTPAGRIEVTRVALDHALTTGVGSATLNVDALRFGKSLQPEMLTPLTLGIVADVRGEVTGRGEIRWGAKGVTSDGEFRTRGLDFAAAFGPVNGLKGAIRFDDLLALSTPPHQQVTITSINPGTLVTNGVIDYQLRPGQRIEIEGGRWPFAGGALMLEPALIDMQQQRERRLTFRVVALDAAKFVQRLEFENLAATGTFDGIMPMYFNADGGRIEGGELSARLPGGTVAYVGEVSNAQLNPFAKLAFDALKSIRYRNLTIALNGPLDGEIISQIKFDGVNQAPLAAPKSFIAKRLTGLPFRFNIKVAAPFRNLLNTARTFQDPTSLLQRTLPEMRDPPVQPAESEKKP